MPQIPPFSVWSEASFTDRMYLVYFSVAGILVFSLRHRVSNWPTLLALHLAGLAITLALVANARRFSIAHAWYPLVMPVLTFQAVAHLSFLFADAWRDRYLLAFESWLFREPPTVWLSRFASPLVTEALELGYLSYFAILLIVAAVLYRRATKAPFAGVMAASTFSYMICYAMFIIFPTEGPAHTLRRLHTVPLTGGPFHWMVVFIQYGGVHGNAFPSAHVAGAVAPLIFAWRYARKVAAWLTPLVVLLCIGAVYDRYHYASDVFAGIVVGAAAAWFVMFAQKRPQWTRQLHLA